MSKSLQLVAIGALSVIVVKAPTARAEDEPSAVVALKELDAVIGHKDKKDDGPVIEVQLSSIKVTDADLEHLKALKSLQTLVLYNCAVTDNGLEYLEDITSLRILVITRSVEGLPDLANRVPRITDEGLRHLEGLGNLTWVSLCDSAVSNVGVARLKRHLPQCEITIRNP